MEVILYLLAAQIALKIFSFQQLTWFFEQRAKQPELTGDARAQARKEVRSAILIIRRYSFIATTCFHRAMVAQAMLRRRGVSVTLYYGAATLPTRGLTTHAWVQDGEEGIVGHVTARQERYHILAQYPQAQS